jgi:thiamine-phosphate pyrophosphorylase
VDWLQLRDRELSGAALLAWSRELAEAAARGAACRGGRARVLVNRRLDVALAIGADGAHLGFDAVRTSDARSLLGPDALLGVSAHTPDEVAAAARDGVDYAHLAPIFEPLSKAATRPALGTAVLSSAGREAVAVIAQGGVTAREAGTVVRCGAAGIAVTGAILGADDPGAATRALRKALDAALDPAVGPAAPAAPATGRPTPER